MHPSLPGHCLNGCCSWHAQQLPGYHDVISACLARREEKDQCELVHKMIKEHNLDGDYRWLVRSKPYETFLFTNLDLLTVVM